ncbi:ExbD/TolR family protein [Bdellovibrio svalbardensis]|uniref:Biopolymer transporter ExbD n=1 Tax=Bdellovibrio svalbardensis TaxID=2972972 RepID=A0ABT6DLM0_9BACT|nr:biopolymer transporter ExbD [Bdellovibrio svalbardensis]MDG0817551.1 biopolymer transporter ExbD [Bdellovibrio svalbardensis]
MRRAKKIKINHHSEFDLDLAPLLAVMVKLVPVLLVSSAFVQMMVIETELPQVVSEAIQKQDQDKTPTIIALEVDGKDGFNIVVTEKGQDKVENVPMKDGAYDLPALHQKLVAVKKAHPEIFKLELNPDSKVPYKEIVKIMDEVRQAHDPSVKFPVFDTKQGKNVDTPYMFPEIVFSNMMEG